MLATVARHTAKRSWASTAQHSLYNEPLRSLSSAGRNDDSNKGNGQHNNKDDEYDEEDDQFGLSGFELDDIEDDDAEAALNDLSEAGEDITPELASEMVARMVKTASRSLADKVLAKGDILSAISPHTISVLRASRISTNSVQAALSNIYVPPITKKVVAQINIPELNLTKPAEEALKYLAGPRLHGDVIKFSANKFPSRAENQTFIVSQLDRLVLAAKTAVGDIADTAPLESWEEVVEEVKRQAAEDILEAGGLSLLIGEPKTTFEVKAAP